MTVPGPAIEQESGRRREREERGRWKERTQSGRLAAVGERGGAMIYDSPFGKWERETRKRKSGGESSRVGFSCAGVGEEGAAEEEEEEGGKGRRRNRVVCNGTETLRRRSDEREGN